MLQWEWLGGISPLRRAAVVGAGAWGTALAVAFARAGLDVELGCRSREQARGAARDRENARYLPGVALPERVKPCHAAELELAVHDLVCLAVPARDLPAVLAAHGSEIPQRAGVLVVSKGLVPPLGTLPSAYAAERVQARTVAALAGPSHAADALEHGASVVLATLDDAFAPRARARARQRRLRRADDARRRRRRAGRLREERRRARGRSRRTPRPARTSPAPPPARSSPRSTGSRAASARRPTRSPGSPARATSSRPSSPTAAATAAQGELLGRGVPAAEIAPALGHAVEAVDTVPLLAALLREAELPAPATLGLAALVEGRIEPEHWTAAVTQPTRRPRRARAA